MDYSDWDWSYWKQRGYSKVDAKQMANRKVYVDTLLGGGKSRSELQKKARKKYPISTDNSDDARVPVKYVPNDDKQENRDAKRKNRANKLARQHEREAKHYSHMKFSNPYVINILPKSPR